MHPKNVLFWRRLKARSEILRSTKREALAKNVLFRRRVRGISAILRSKKSGAYANNVLFWMGSLKRYADFFLKDGVWHDKTPPDNPWRHST